MNDTGCASRLIDAHVHIKGASGLDAVARAGVFAARDAGTRDGAGLGIGKAITRDPAPLIISAGRALWKKGGYGSLFGSPVGTRDEIKSEILKLSGEGAGIIKAMASGMVSLKEPGRVTAGGFNAEELRFIAAQAAERGLGVMAHANGEEAIMNAARSGARSIEHGFFMSKRALDVMAKDSVFWVPTTGALRRAAGSGTISPSAREFISGLIRSQREMILHAYKIGVHLAVGTDFVLPGAGYREAYDEELAHFQEAGLSRGETLMIACEGGAKLLGIEYKGSRGKGQGSK